MPEQLTVTGERAGEHSSPYATDESDETTDESDESDPLPDHRDTPDGNATLEAFGERGGNQSLSDFESD